MSVRLTLVTLVTLAACDDRQGSDRPPALPIETAIARDLTARFNTSVAVTCRVLTVVPVACTAKLADGIELPIAITHRKREWDWRIDGVVIETKPIVAYVRDGLASVHIAEAVDCGPPVQVIQPGDRVVCKLGGGGAAFVSFAGDGTASLELALDAATAAARTELVTPDRERELAQQSAELEGLAGDSDGEEAVTGDAGVATDAGTP